MVIVMLFSNARKNSLEMVQNFGRSNSLVLRLFKRTVASKTIRVKLCQFTGDPKSVEAV